MSIQQTIRTALSGLSVSQKSIQVAADNLANENVEGYSRKEVHQASLYAQSTGLGVYISQIKRVVNDGMNKEVRIQGTKAAYTDGLAEYHRRLQSVIGKPNDSQSLGTLFNNFQSALQKAASTPQSSVFRQNVINTAVMLTQKIRTISAELCQIRQDADQEISSNINLVNQYAQQILDINGKIGLTSAQGQNNGDLEDKRDILLSKISGLMDVQYFMENNAMQLRFASRPLLTGSMVYPFSYTPVSSVVTPDILYSSGLIQPITLLNQDMTTKITTGRIGALLYMRDQEIPNNLQAQLDEMAQDLRDQINMIYNTGTSYQPRTTMTGNRAFAAGGATAFSGTGTLRIGVTDSTGMFVNEFSLNLATVGTLNALITAINTAASWNTGVSGVTASLNGSNQLVLTSTSGNGFSLASIVGVAQETSTGLGFSHYFGLNDFFTSGTRLVQDGNALGRIGISNVLDVRSDIVANDRILSTGVLSAVTPFPLAPITLNIGLTAGDGSILQAMDNALLNTNQSFATAGNISALTTSFLNYTSYIISQISQSASDNADLNDYNKRLLANLESKAKEVSGVNKDEEIAFMILCEEAYKASARVLSTLSSMMDALERIKS